MAGFLLVFLLGAARPSAASTPVHGPQEAPSTWSAFWRSALLPGWGQWHRGDRRLAWGYAGTFGLSMGLAAWGNAQGNANYDRYSAAGSAADASFYWEETRKADNLAVISGDVALGLYAVSLVDALFFTRWLRQGSAAVQPPASLSFAIVPGGAWRTALELRL